MGSGIWAMHFVAMLAFHLPYSVTYDLLITLISLLYAILASGLALWLINQFKTSFKLLLGGGICMGCAIAWMHYTGMEAMQLQARIQYNYSLVALSVTIAIFASLIALWLTFRLQVLSPQQLIWQKLVSAVVMAIAISGMHYTGMAATVFIPDSTQPTPQHHLVNPSLLAFGIGLATLLLLALTLATFLLNQWLTVQLMQQQALHDSEKRFRILIREMQVGVILLNANAEVLVCNQAAIDLLNLGSALVENQIFGQAWCLLHEDGTLFVLEQLPVQQSIRQRRPVRDVVVGIDRSNETRRWLLISAEPYIDAEGRIEQVVCTLTDITKQKQAELALRQMAERERAVTQILLQMRQTLDIETIFQATTSELRQAMLCDRVAIYRFNPDWSGRFVAESVDAGWQVLVQIQDSQTSLTQKAIAAENCVVAKLDGIEPETEPETEPESSFSSAMPSIKDTYLQETQGGIYRRGISYRCVPDIYKAGFNRCYLNLLEQFQARAYIIVPIFCGKKLWGLLATYQNASPRCWEESEIKMVCQIGTQLGVAVQQAELLAQTRQQAEELGAAKETADAANRAKSEFLASMSHELRTPLNAILGFAQLMSDDSSLSTDQKDYVNIINRSGEHLLRLINDILEMSKIEAGRTTLNPIDIDLYRLLASLIEMFQLSARSKGLILNLDYTPDVPQVVLIDEGKLRQILINLLGNAIKFTEYGTVTLRVRVQDIQRTQQVAFSSELPHSSPIFYTLLFEVEDTGIGIADDEIEQLFQMFRQTQSGFKSKQGTGLGLAISQKFVQLMGGEINASSVVGKGSKFSFSIQASLSQKLQPMRSPFLRKKVIGLAPNQPKYRILVVEDQTANRLLLVKLLTPLGFQIQEAENGEQAVQIWETYQPHLIWMDMRMPVMDGFEATQQIRDRESKNREGSPANCSIPTKIIALTASAFEEQRQSILASGCDDFVRKPFREEEILEKMTQHLGVTYCYEDNPTQMGTLSPETITSIDQPSLMQELSPTDLAGMPPDWLQQLHHAASQGSDFLILKLIEQIPPQQATVAMALSELVSDFRFDQIIALAQASLS